MHFGFESRMPITPDDVLLVLGAGGGVGGAAVDIAGSRGCTVIGCGSSDASRDRARGLGAGHVVDRSDPYWPARVRELYPNGVGGPILGFASGDIPRLGGNRILVDNHAVMGVDFGDAVRRRPALG